MSSGHQEGRSSGSPAGLPTLPVGLDPQLSTAAWISPTHLCGGKDYPDLPAFTDRVLRRRGSRSGCRREMEDPVVLEVHLQALTTPLTAQQGTVRRVCSQHNSSSNTGRRKGPLPPHGPSATPAPARCHTHQEGLVAPGGTITVCSTFMCGSAVEPNRGWSKGSRGGGWGCLDLISQDVLCVFGNLSFSLQKAGWAPAIRSPSIHSPPTSRENLTFKSPTHTYWTAVLSPVQIGKREMERSSLLGEANWNEEWLQKFVVQALSEIHCITD
ncbi:hypothetical protein F7725_010354 [Dissostichus mawsoni]|uniref:Uncharacterized protein n=1 Tax=Dissostichus mawsoni TaxID=36200 RepID=A0A7J5XN87_DISMA|nr:hypothetical protein F7725_010354 [Dissostichus mawsoni]